MSACLLRYQDMCETNTSGDMVDKAWIDKRHWVHKPTTGLGLKLAQCACKHAFVGITPRVSG